MAAAPAVPRTLDVKELQILRHYPGDINGFSWHHSLLMHEIPAGIWIALTPDDDLERIDLNNTVHVTLDRRSDFLGLCIFFIAGPKTTASVGPQKSWENEGVKPKKHRLQPHHITYIPPT